ncbi:HTH CENPB-type domain-containing protein [Trichonephila inaurata madagascariensis]|uniref:HTH CENPB-type domain-containing protein n=1 Tax=Trichonephila inaurata madagascariensis TaxID=2747483 RepID=A0A8X6YAZ6_9ARAC|nr:HTH CENPB-type domain-containing protein [Trichonephila inaurata madagascariensis]
MAKKHPTWSIKTLHSRGCESFKKEHLPKWEEDIIKREEINLINMHLLIPGHMIALLEARKNFHQITTRNLQQWALSAAGQFKDFEFKASKRWVEKLKKEHKIRQRKITKYVSQKETSTLEEILKSAETFRIQTLHLMPKFDIDFVINTDRTACQYQSTFNRTLADKGS